MTLVVNGSHVQLLFRRRLHDNSVFCKFTTAWITHVEPSPPPDSEIIAIPSPKYLLNDSSRNITQGSFHKTVMLSNDFQYLGFRTDPRSNNFKTRNKRTFLVRFKVTPRPVQPLRVIC